MRTVLICHHNEALNRDLLPRWMASFSNLTGILLIRDDRSNLKQRFKREFKRVGPIRILDVLTFRLVYRLTSARHDYDWEKAFLQKHLADYPESLQDFPILETDNPNGKTAAEFIKNCQPDLILARCKHLLKPSIFEIPDLGTYVLHPGICPEYRNAHGCFWALLNRDLDKVGATLLKIDRGIDTGPIFDFFTYAYDEKAESHIRIQNRVVFENLAAIRNSLLDIEAGRAEAIDVSNRPSGNWGQPWLSAWIRWKRTALRSTAKKS